MSNPPPNPNVKGLSRQEPKTFPPFTANFSLEFVDWCVDNYAFEESIILDNFAGSCTTLLSSSSKGFESFGIELNPIWVIYGQARLVRMKDNIKNRVQEILNCFKKNNDGNYLYNYLITKSLYEETTDDNYILSAAILLAYREKINPIYGMNHSWPVIKNDDVDLPKYNEIKVQIVKIYEHIKWIKKYYDARETSKLIFGDSTSISNYPDKFDLLITSPPYLSRLDYIVSTRPENILLKKLDIMQSEKSYRKKQIGTPVTDKTIEYDENAMPSSCKKIIELVSNHKSKGSMSYYKNIIENYFYKMHSVINILDEIATNDAKIIFVIRDSWYKDIYIATSDLLKDIFFNTGWNISKEWRFSIKYMLSSANPNIKNWRQDTTVAEKIMLFERV